MKKVLPKELLDAEKLFLSLYKQEQGPERLQTCLCLVLQDFWENRTAKFQAKRAPAHDGKEVMEAVCVDRGVTVEQLRGPSKHRGLVRARWLVCELLRRQGASLPAIGKVLWRHHATVFGALQEVRANPELMAIADRLYSGLKVTPAAPVEPFSMPDTGEERAA